MTNFKEYFRSHLKSGARVALSILLVILALTFILAFSGQHDYTGNLQCKIDIPVIFLCILIYVLPVKEFAFFKKRTNLDCAYALPISRRTMGIVHYLCGLIELCVLFSASYLLNFIMLLARGGGELFNLGFMLEHYLICLAVGTAMYSLMVFVFNEGNTKGDGIWFMILYSFVFILIAGALQTITEKITTNISSFIPPGFIANITNYYRYLIEGKSIPDYNAHNYENLWLFFIIWIAFGIAACADLFRTFGKRRMEKTEEISDSLYGYRVLIPIFAVTGNIVFRVVDIIVFWVIIELFAILGYTIYRRGFHYKKSDIAVLLLLIIFLFI